MSMAFELRKVSNLVQLVKNKQPQSLRARVLSRQMLLDICNEYPLTFASIMCPEMTRRQVISIIQTNANAQRELTIYQNKLNLLF